ncbi:hypothetical protein ACFWYW_30260 [Nonomuraea sp. NPDC059023]|uniref:hypothetical protein n=1 Tax=unclassified Nonomuraea TaxID=2593643 RepID=UPI0036866635
MPTVTLRDETAPGKTLAEFALPDLPEHAARPNLNHPAGHRLRLHRETLELPAESQQIIVFLPADHQTARAIDRLKASRPINGS